MKRSISIIILLCLLLGMCGCKKPPNPPESTPTDTTAASTIPTNPTTPTNPTSPTDATQTPTVPSSPGASEEFLAVSVPAVTENTASKDGTVLFQYTYQHMSLIHPTPDVANKIILNFLNRVDSTRSLAQATAASAASVYNGGSNWVPYMLHVTYSPTRLDSKVLSLFGAQVLFNGSNHADKSGIAASYDLLTGDVLTLASIMNKQATTDSICDLVLDALSKHELHSYLYKGYVQTVKQRFTKEASQDEAWYFTQTGLCFYFAPYEIAPYSSGIISVEIPYEKLKGILYGAYLPYERAAAQGTVTITPFAQTDLTKFSQIAELVAEKSGKMYMASADGTVQDIRIAVTDKTGNYTVFAACNLKPGDGIMIQASDSLLSRMKMTYYSGKETVSIPLSK